MLPQKDAPSFYKNDDDVLTCYGERIASFPVIGASVLLCIVGKARQVYLYSTFQQQGNSKCFTQNMKGIKKSITIKNIKNSRLKLKQ